MNKDKEKQGHSDLFVNKNFLLLWSSQILTQVALGVFTISLAILSDKGTLNSDLQGTSTGIGLVVLISNIPALILSPIAGVIADWIHKKRIMIFINLARFVIVTLYILFRGWENLFLSYFIILLMNSVSQFFIPAEGASIPSIVNKKDILLANSLFSLTIYGTFIFGVAGAGQFINMLGENGTFMLICGMFLIATVVLFFSEIPKIELMDGRKLGIRTLYKELFSAVKGGFNYIKEKKLMQYVLLHIFLVQVAILTSVTLIFRIGRELFDIESSNIGTFILFPAAIGVGLGFFIMNTLSRDKERFRIINEGVFTIGIGIAILTIVAILKHFSTTEIPYSFFVSGFAIFVIAFGAPFVVIPPAAFINEQTDENFRGRVYGIWMAVYQTMASIPAFLFGLLVDKLLNLYGVMLFGTFFVFAYTGILYLVRKKLNIG
jgi:MFS family permease